MSKKTYQAPRMKVVEVQQAEMLCTSPGGNKSMYEVDYGDGGFQ